MDKKQHPPKPGMEQFKGNPMKHKKAPVPSQEGIGKRKDVTKND